MIPVVFGAFETVSKGWERIILILKPFKLSTFNRYFIFFTYLCSYGFIYLSVFEFQRNLKFKLSGGN